MDLKELTEKLRTLESNIEHLSQSIYDEFVEENAKTAVKSGVKAVLVRRQTGKCCDWCAKLTGVYDYGKGDYPDDVFARHKHCKCMVTVRNEKGGYQDVWSKKEYSTQAEARRARLEELEAERKNEDAFTRLKSIARANGQLFVDSTDYYLNTPLNGKGKVTNCPQKFTLNGQEHEIKGKKIVLAPSPDERSTADWYADYFGEKVVLMPKFNDPPKIKCGDYLINGVRYDLKTPIGDGKNVIDNQVHDKKKQAKNFIINISKINLPTAQIIEQTKSVMASKNRLWVEKIMLVDGKAPNLQIVKVFERV